MIKLKSLVIAVLLMITLTGCGQKKDMKSKQTTDQTLIENENLNSTIDDSLESGTEVLNDLTEEEAKQTNDSIVTSENITKESQIDISNDRMEDTTEVDSEETTKVDPNSYDSDNDGLTDELEVRYNSDPMATDSDKDGISDGNEKYSYTMKTPDSEMDGVVEPSVTLDIEGKYIHQLSIKNVLSNPFLAKIYPDTQEHLLSSIHLWHLIALK